MKIEKLTENKIRIILKHSELPNNENFNILINTDINTNKFILNILNKAEKDYGFNTENCKLLVEAYYSVEDLFIMTITKISTYKKNSNLKIHKKNKKYFSHPLVYEFSSFEEYCLLCDVIKNEKIPIENIANQVSLYLYNNTYYLVFYKLNLSYKHFRKLFSYISEFSTSNKYSESFTAKIMEYGKAISVKNALKIGIKYFVK